MRQKCYLALATCPMRLISYYLRLSHMGSDVGQIFPTSSLHRDHSILFAFVCEKELSHKGKNNGNPDLVCKKMSFVLVLNYFKKQTISCSWVVLLVCVDALNIGLAPYYAVMHVRNKHRIIQRRSMW